MTTPQYSTSSRTIWERDKLSVDVALSHDGDLTFSGQDLSGHPWSEYEYWLTVKAADVRKVTAALGGAPGSDVLALLDENAEAIVREVGEKAWLKNHSIPATFWSRIEPAE